MIWVQEWIEQWEITGSKMMNWETRNRKMRRMRMRMRRET